jgi:hypothetical protein
MHILWKDKPTFLYISISATGGSGTVSKVHARVHQFLRGINICGSIWLTSAWLDMATVQLPHWPCGLVFLLSMLLAVCHSVVQENGVLATFLCTAPAPVQYTVFQWITHDGRIFWPMKSTDLNFLYLFLLRHFRQSLLNAILLLWPEHCSRTFSFLEYENVRLKGWCSSVHPLEVKGTCLEISYLWM